MARIEAQPEKTTRIMHPARPHAILNGFISLVRGGGVTRFAPTGAMLADPIRQRLFKADVASGLFRLDPFVTENFLALGLEFAVERGVLQQIVCRRCFFSSVRHSEVQLLIQS